jgi:hypothetical protein
LHYILYWQEFHTNFNFVAVDYLVYTQEMIGQIRQSFPVEIILPAVVLVAALLTWWQMRYFPRNFSPKGKKGCLAGAVPADPAADGGSDGAEGCLAGEGE